jgi:hypothetical protein
MAVFFIEEGISRPIATEHFIDRITEINIYNITNA